MLLNVKFILNGFFFLHDCCGYDNGCAQNSVFSSERRKKKKKHIQKQLLLFVLFAQKLMCFYTENRSIFVRDWKLFIHRILYRGISCVSFILLTHAINWRNTLYSRLVFFFFIFLFSRVVLCIFLNISPFFPTFRWKIIKMKRDRRSKIIRRECAKVRMKKNIGE